MNAIIDFAKKNRMMLFHYYHSFFVILILNSMTYTPLATPCMIEENTEAHSLIMNVAGKILMLQIDKKADQKTSKVLGF